MPASSILTEGFVAPMVTRKSVRPDNWHGLTSCNPGVVTPIAFFDLLREDRIRASGSVQVTSEETVKVIVNPVRIRVEAFLIPKTCLERFQGSLEVLNRAYAGEPAPPGMGTTPKWFMPTAPMPVGDTGHELLDRLGVHWADGEILNTDLVESYNLLHNWMRKNVSPGLPLASLTNTTCLPAFWDSWRFSDIKPSFDAAQMEGVVPVTIGGDPLVKTLGDATDGVRADITLSNRYVYAGSTAVPEAAMIAELNGAEASISLANFETAKEAQIFAKMRDRYKSVPDEYLIDILMAGINIPDADLRQPIRLAFAEGIIGQTQRYATDGASLDTSVANGMAVVNFTINCPPVNTGGKVLVVLSVVPEQLYERIDDIALNYVDGSVNDVHTPDYVADYLDPQKVEVVPNSFADCRHSDPTGVFGYAPLNYQWRRAFSRVGGKFKRPVPDAFVEDRQRIWSVEKTDPELGTDFYMCPVPFPKSVFADTEADPYEVVTVIQASIIGNTVFGPGFEEDMGSYEAIMAEVDTGRIDQTDTTTLDAPVGDIEKGDDDNEPA